jgi:OOP family OmpA-OmpF porin
MVNCINKKQLLSTILILFSFNFVSIYAQTNISTDTLKNFQIKRLGQNAVRIGDTYSAIIYYEKYLEKNPDNYELWFELGHLYRKARDYQKAEKTYKHVLTNKGFDIPESQFYYAKMLKANGNYQASKEEYTKFSESKATKEVENIKQLKKLAKAEITGCETAIELLKGKYNTLVTHLNESINKAHVELSPVMIDTLTLLYASINKENLQLYNLDKQDTLPVRKFYMAQKDSNQWIGGIEYPGPFNEKDANVGNGAFSPDGTRFYYSKCNYNSQGKMICRIMVSNREKSKWSKPSDLGELVNSNDFTSTMPAVGIDTKKKQEVIYFISNRPGGKGGMDIWYTTFDSKKKTYKEAKNVGGTINTVGDELTPTYDVANRTLYFSSDGFPGLGELDIFQSIGELKSWSVPENIGAPYNSSADDIYYTKGKKLGEKHGFFVSNRKGGVSLLNETCCDDIYEFSDPHYLDISVHGNVYEVSNDSLETKINGLPKLPISLFKINKDGTEHLLRTTLTDDKGDYFFQLEQGNKYKVHAEKSGYLSKKMEITTETILKSDSIPLSFGIKPIPKGSIVISNIYYETAKAELKPESKNSLDKELVNLLKDNPQLIIEVSAHTDDVGSNEYNQKLSQQRAESVVNYLINNGITKERMVAKGYGESKPIAPNTTPEGRQKNRRTEFKIIGYLKNIEINYEE